MAWDRLAPQERQELETALQDPSRFLSDFGDSSAWWLLLLIASSAGTVAAQMQGGIAHLRGFVAAIDGGYGLESVLRSLLYPVAFLASLTIVVWTGMTWIRNYRRRGFAVTSFATIRVKGPRLLLVRHGDVTRLEWTQHAPPRKQRFSVLRLTGTDGRTLTLYVHAGWVRTAIAQIDQSRAAAKLPPIADDARIVPE